VNIIIGRSDLQKTIRNQKIEDVTLSDIDIHKKSLNVIQKSDCIIYVHGSQCKVLKHRFAIIIDPVCDINMIPSILFKSMEPNPDTKINLCEHILSLVKLLDIDDIIRIKTLIEKEGFKML